MPKSKLPSGPTSAPSKATSGLAYTSWARTTSVRVDKQTGPRWGKPPKPKAHADCQRAVCVDTTGRKYWGKVGPASPVFKLGPKTFAAAKAEYEAKYANLKR